MAKKKEPEKIPETEKKKRTIEEVDADVQRLIRHIFGVDK